MSAEIVNRAQSRLGLVLNGKWRLDEVLGVGGMATVYAAMHRNQKRVAVKMLHTELSLEDGVRTRFLREGYLANTVDHPGAVTVFDDDIAEDGSAFLVMELLEGETIHSRVQREGSLPVRQALRMADEVLDVLVAAHGKRIIHRDLKPENLFITRDGHVKVLDFGIARLRELPLGSPSATASGFFMGTPAFMAPEHARGKWSEVDAPSDLWSVGATLFTMLTGKFVHESETAMDTLVMAVTRRAPSIRTVVPDLDTEVCELIDRALAFEKVDRWSSAREMQNALRLAMFHLEGAVAPVSPVGSYPRSPAEAGSVDERPPATPPFASPPYSPLRVYHATVRSARPPAPPHLSTDAPLTSSLPPESAAPKCDAHGRSGSGVSVTGGGTAKTTRKVSARVVTAVSLLLVALPAGWLLLRGGRAPSPPNERTALVAADVPAREADTRPFLAADPATAAAVAPPATSVAPAASLVGAVSALAPRPAAPFAPAAAELAAAPRLVHSPIAPRPGDLRLPRALAPMPPSSAAASPVSAVSAVPSAPDPVAEPNPFDRRF